METKNSLKINPSNNTGSSPRTKKNPRNPKKKSENLENSANSTNSENSMNTKKPNEISNNPSKKIQRPSFLDNEDEKVTMKDIKKALNYYVKVHNALMNAQRRISVNGKNRIEREELHQFNLKFCQELRDFDKQLMKIKKNEKRRVNRDRNRNAGFLGPKVFKPALINFFKDKEVDLGPMCYMKDGKIVESDKPLKSELSLFLNSRITSSSLLTPLFNIYIKRNKDMILKDNAQCIKFTAPMRKYFGEACKEVEKVMKAEKKEIEERIKKGELKPNVLNKVYDFSLERFRRPRLQTLIKFLTVPTEELSQKEKELLESPETLTRLKYEQEIVSLTNKFYRNEKNEEEENEEEENGEK
ncbi:MAG: hypothetical protein QW350_05575 [Candidatus Aenigmatarchaeota archaeon]